MSQSVIKKPQVVWESATLYHQSYGDMIAYYNLVLKIATITWSGGSVQPPDTRISIPLPAYLTPKRNFSVPMRNGDNLEVRIDGAITVFAGRTWSGATITYPLA